jgi:hypothetical protein
MEKLKDEKKNHKKFNTIKCNLYSPNEESSKMLCRQHLLQKLHRNVQKHFKNTQLIGFIQQLEWHQASKKREKKRVENIYCEKKWKLQLEESKALT